MRQVRQPLAPGRPRPGAASAARAGAARPAPAARWSQRGRIVVLGNDQQVELRMAQQAADAGPHAVHDAAAMALLQPQRHRRRPAAGGDHQRRPGFFDQRPAGPAGTRRTMPARRGAARPSSEPRRDRPATCAIQFQVSGMRRNGTPRRSAMPIACAAVPARGSSSTQTRSADGAAAVRLVGLAVAHADGRPGMRRLMGRPRQGMDDGETGHVRGSYDRLGPGRRADDGAHPAGDQGGQFPARGTLYLHLGLEVARLYRLPADHLLPRAPAPRSASWGWRRSAAISATRASTWSPAARPPASPSPPGSPTACWRRWPMCARSRKASAGMR